MRFNRLNKNGSWTVCGEYQVYRNEGGKLSPSAWNAIIKEQK